MGTRDVAEPIHRNSLEPGYRLHWYRIDRVLGQGGFGITYFAHDANLDHEVAIKEYMPDGLAVREPDASVRPASDAHAERFKWGIDRFMAEARTLDRFKHPNIVRVRAVFEANGTGYMVMEYEHGDSLKTVLADCRTMEEGEISKFVLPLLGGLEKVHERGFIHRDIKPANIMIREDGSPVLIDFGSARQALGATRQTLTALVSPGYAPYEQYFDKGGQQGPWTDIYGLGATLYRAVTGKPPEDAMDRSRAILDGARDTLEDVRALGWGRYSAPFLEAIDHALRFRHQDRPQSVAEWRLEFGALPDKQPIPKARDSAMIATTIPGDEPRNVPDPPKPPSAASRPTPNVQPPAAGPGREPAPSSAPLVAPGTRPPPPLTRRLTRRNRYASALGLLGVTVAGAVVYLDPNAPPGTAHMERPTTAAEGGVAAVEARRGQAEAALRAADAALAQDDAPSMLARLDEARKAGAEPAVLDERRGRLRDRIETLAAAAKSDVEQARKKKDPDGIRAAVKRLRDLNAQAAALDSAQP